MDFKSNFAIRGVASADSQATTAPSRSAAIASTGDPLGPLASLVGVWSGSGFNQIWRPFHDPSGKQDHFLQLNFTIEQLEFDRVPGAIPNRGFLQDDINLFGVRYLQQIQDAHVLDHGKPAGLHVEPGLWVTVPSTTNPSESSTVARMGTIPHGTSILAQGQATTAAGAPTFPRADIVPFTIGNPSDPVQFPEQDLGRPSSFRTPPADIPGLTQSQLDDVNGFLAQGLVGKTVNQTTTLAISTSIQQVNPPNAGGGTSNIAFLLGATANGANAQAAQVDATFWIETLVGSDGSETLQLQYTQRVLLNVNTLSWPHVSVATLQLTPGT
jgi:hypothetical protein